MRISDWSSDVCSSVLYLQRAARNRLAAAGVEQAKLAVDLRGSRLDQAQRTNERTRHFQSGHRKVVDGALRLSAPECVGRDFQLDQAVVFETECRLRHAVLLISAGRAAHRPPRIN